MRGEGKCKENPPSSCRHAIALDWQKPLKRPTALRRGDRSRRTLKTTPLDSRKVGGETSGIASGFLLEGYGEKYPEIVGRRDRGIRLAGFTNNFRDDKFAGISTKRLKRIRQKSDILK
jgi:hypothetical protein